MSRRRLNAVPRVPESLLAGFAQLREEMRVPAAFPEDVVAEAEAAAAAPVPTDGREDLRAVEFVTIDPPTSRDLDQAMCIARTGGGFLLRYAIADVGAFVRPGGAMEREAWTRGTTIYAPDGKTPLYPQVLSEGAASLLPDVDRPSVVFEVPVDGDGEAGPGRVFRAVVRSRAKLAYGTGGGDVPLLRELGTALAAAAARRGAVEIDLPGQQVVPAGTPEGFTLALETRTPDEDWNAQISLCANVAGARLMLAAGMGLFRVLGPPDPDRVAGLQAAAVALGLAPPDVHDGLRAVAACSGPERAVHQLRRSARSAVPTGAGYRFWETGGEPPFHSAVAAPYAHATAPLRRLADRYVLDLLVELSAGRPAPPGTAGTLGRLPEVMGRAEALADRLENACIDLVEATLLRAHVGERFAAVVWGSNERGARIQLREPPVRATLPGSDARPGSELEVQLAEADPARRVVAFRAA
ncbi:MAG: RNB domain-containing ribonuclease [Thermoleophilia bacterium]